NEKAWVAVAQRAGTRAQADLDAAKKKGDLKAQAEHAATLAAAKEIEREFTKAGKRGKKGTKPAEPSKIPVVAAQEPPPAGAKPPEVIPTPEKVAPEPPPERRAKGR